MTCLDDYLASLRVQNPGYVILLHQGNWYRVWDQDADVIHRILNRDVVPVNGHRTISVPVSVNIKDVLRAHRYAYKIIRDTVVTETYNPRAKKSNSRRAKKLNFSFSKKPNPPPAKKSNPPPVKQTNPSLTDYSSRHGSGWVDGAWVPGLPSSRFYRKRKHF